MTGSISSKTNYLLAGRDGGESKLEKAREFKVKVISEDDLLHMIASRPADLFMKCATLCESLEIVATSFFDR